MSPCRGTPLSLAERKADLHAQMLPFGCIDLLVMEALEYDITG